jgi:UDP-N-acetyl-alpha-D-muramoyl-L-alanyl-L-glutamate epimerase
MRELKTMSSDPMVSAIVPANRREACALLRVRHRRFFYESFSLDLGPGLLRAKFHFRIEPDIEFSPVTVIEGIDPKRVESLPGGVLENLIFHVGLVEMLSYWKAACSPQIAVRAGTLDSEQIAWWMDLLAHGMGEFFYVNQIRFGDDFVKITSQKEVGSQKSEVRSAKANPSRERKGAVASRMAGDRDLVLTSGGKDSVVTLELLREAARDFDCLLLNPTPASLAVAREAGCAAPRVVRRTIDPRLLELNAAGYLNGHTPFSALLAFLGVAVAVLSGSRSVVVSNERSAEEAAAEFLGREVNHQYSKSLRFESAFRSYSKKYLAPSVDYFSLLRPLYELQIARLFAEHTRYFPLFRSCNRGMATNSWCGRCPKCLFVYTALYPFVERGRMLAIFGADLFAWEGAAEVLRALLGLDRDKPFECVGTRDETLAALFLCVEKYKEQGIEIPQPLAAIEKSVLSSRTDLPELARRVLGSWTDQNHLPPEMAETLRQKAIRR